MTIFLVQNTRTGSPSPTLVNRSHCGGLSGRSLPFLNWRVILAVVRLFVVVFAVSSCAAATALPSLLVRNEADCAPSCNQYVHAGASQSDSWRCCSAAVDHCSSIWYTSHLDEHKNA
ncbi:Satellite-like RNA [Rhodosporidiobolus odoratus dsRNA Virus 1 satellite]|uniref:Satellite-like RNA n=1 Tax=Rhodosporidiobolus odoratus dsRNA Virus 1 satellite TaxID=2787046 RepID=A0A7U3SNG9_9VIRU|nr:Satellite-like RNA [Rhodosporidiobolus odoratus dsRNA Virus 1 satellite]